MTETCIGVMGGTGLYEMDGLDVQEEREIETPFGAPSDSYVIGELAGRRLVFLPRHGRGHRLLPSEINYRANVYGMKVLGATHLVSVSAVGSMRERYAPGDVVLPDQFLDRTRRGGNTFFGNGLVAHVSLADPVCGGLSRQAHVALGAVGARAHFGGTYVCIEGPQFSTRAESHTYRGWGVDIIGMTNMQEARLAREAELCYTCLASVTDYDCWKEDEEDVSGESVMVVLERNADTARKGLRALVERFDDSRDGCSCASALSPALITDFDLVPEQTLESLAPLIARFRD